MVPTHRIATGGECSNVLQMLGRRDGWLQTVGKQLDDTVVVINIMVNIVPAELLQSCLTLCDLVDSSQPGSSVHGILQARILKWVAMFSSRVIFLTQGSNPCFFCLLHWQAGSLALVPAGKPTVNISTSVNFPFCLACIQS